MLISIDHGNKQIKTVHKTFVSGLRESDTPPQFGQNVLFYDEKYYTLSDQRIPYMRDKTADERFFVLTLFAIGFELQRALLAESPAKIQLCVGLPPAHYGTLYQKFEQYFLGRGQVDFRMDGTPYSILITEAVCFPQAYAATIPVYPKLQQLPKAVIVDIGGITADYLQMRYGQADLSVCDSLENGVIVLYNCIKSKVSAVQHYLHCPETPDIPQMSPIDTRTIEDIVRKILQHQDKSALIRESVKEHCRQDIPKAESFYYEETADLLDAEGLATIADTMEAFRKNSG